MKQGHVAGILILLTLVLGLDAAATVLLAPPIRALVGLLLVSSTVLTADLVATNLRRRARRMPLPVPDEPAPVEEQATDPTPGAAVEPAEELWLPPLPGPGQEVWVVPALPATDRTPVAEPVPISPTDLIGTKIGPYQVVSRIGQGGMATVYKGFHPGLQRPVAIKILAESLTATPELAQRFRREAQTVAALRHPHIVQVYDFGPLGESHYLAMEYVEGSDLQVEMARRRAENRPFTPGEILQLLGRIAEALDYAHGQGVVHRDVKPGNVLLTAAGQPILTDFGLATLRRTRATLITTIGQNVLGTPEYTAPEQALDAQAAGPRSDVYSLGCMLYEMATGRLPFEAESALSIALMHISEEPAPPRQHAPGLPQAVEAVILRAMAKKPEDRFPTAGAMAEAIRLAWSAPAQAKDNPAEVSLTRLVGTNLGPYQVVEKIGQGGMAAVYKAFHPELHRHVALKVLSQTSVDDVKLAARFQREARTVAALRHPHIVQVHDLGTRGSICYLVMEYVEGTDLRASMKLHKLAKRSWSPDAVLAVLDQVGSALDYAHRQGIIHRDVKPANILISLEGDYFLTDFGISAVRKNRDRQATTLEQPLGTVQYIAPEQAADYHAAVAQSDLYALACIAYEMLTGHLPFESDSPLTLALMHISQDPIPPTFYAPDLCSAVERVILKMLAKEPEQRLLTARAMVETLRRAWEGER